LPSAYRQLLEVREALENYFHDVCDIEFTIEKGRLFILAARPSKRNSRANLRFALQFLSEGRIEIDDVLKRVRLLDVEEFTGPRIGNMSWRINMRSATRPFARIASDPTAQ